MRRALLTGPGIIAAAEAAGSAAPVPSVESGPATSNGLGKVPVPGKSSRPGPRAGEVRVSLGHKRTFGWIKH
jgi:hypothetical protein